MLEAIGLTKAYPGSPPVRALDGASLRVRSGERLAILGPSGSGKSTLLNVLGLLDAADSGSYELMGANTERLSGRERDRLRAKTLGFVFQAYHILPHRTVWENVLLKLSTSGVPAGVRHGLITQVLERVGLTDRSNARGQTLSGGEKQRLALARAVVTSPQVLLADEPTGNLDDVNARSVLDLFDEQSAAGVAVVVITHDQRTAAWADRIVHLHAGRFEDN